MATRPESVGPWTDVTSLMVTSDGQKLVAANADDTVQQWQLPAASLDFTTASKARQYGTNYINVAIVDPTGKNVAVAYLADTQIYIWDISSGVLERTLTGHSGDVWSLAYSPNGKLLASGSGNSNTIKHYGPDDTSIIIWDVVTGERRYQLKGHTDNVQTLAWSKNSQFLASGSLDGDIRLWDIEKLLPK